MFLKLPILGILLSLPSAHAQSFEVAAIRPAVPGTRGYGIQFTPGRRVLLKNVTLAFLVQSAWDVRDFQLSGATGWMNSERFDIEAKLDADVPDTAERLPQVRTAIQKLLADRFNLVSHRETKEMPVYALTIAKEGSRMKSSAAETQSSIMKNGSKIEAQHASMADLARVLSNIVERPVLDRTAIATFSDFTLQWTPDLTEAPATKDAQNPAPPSLADGPSLFTAIREQLGLRLEPQKGPVNIVVIDRAEKPSEN
jgi:uncharacterized protein (TIGR03435 family)